MVNINYRGLDLEIDGDYDKEEKETRWEPGQPEEFIYTKVLWRDKDITDVIDALCDPEEIGNEVLKALRMQHN